MIAELEKTTIAAEDVPELCGAPTVSGGIFCADHAAKVDGRSPP